MVTGNLFWTQGTYMLLILVSLIGIGWRWSRFLLYTASIALFLCFCFFRNPDRLCVDALYDPNVIVCPADGVVVFAGPDEHMPENLSKMFDKKVAIFMSVFDVHVNWVPYAGTVESVQLTSGSFLNAMSSDCSQKNERNDVVIRTASGSKMQIRQIAGLIARQIVCWVSPQDTVSGPDNEGRAQKFGMIRFGSRVELFLPPEAEILVSEGMRVYGGSTVLGRMRS